MRCKNTNLMNICTISRDKILEAWRRGFLFFFLSNFWGWRCVKMDIHKNEFVHECVQLLHFYSYIVFVHVHISLYASVSVCAYVCMNVIVHVYAYLEVFGYMNAWLNMNTSILPVQINQSYCNHNQTCGTVQLQYVWRSLLFLLKCAEVCRTYERMYVCEWQPKRVV